MMSLFYFTTLCKYKLYYFMVFFLLFSFMPVAPLNAEMYIWTDEKGVKHFSNTSPTVDLENVESESEAKSSVIGVEVSGREEMETLEAIKRAIRNTSYKQRNLAKNLPKAEKMIYENLKYLHMYDCFGFTLMHTAASSNAHEIVLLLIAQGADINVANKDGQTPIHNAIDPETLKLLIANGANVNATDKKGRTPLHHIAIENYSRGTRLEVAKVLIRNNAKINIKDKIGKTAVQYSQDNNYTELTKLLSAQN